MERSKGVVYIQSYTLDLFILVTFSSELRSVIRPIQILFLFFLQILRGNFSYNVIGLLSMYVIRIWILENQRHTFSALWHVLSNFKMTFPLSEVIRVSLWSFSLYLSSEVINQNFACLQHLLLSLKTYRTIYDTSSH